MQCKHENLREIQTEAARSLQFKWVQSHIRRLKQTANTFYELIEHQESSWVIISKFNQQSSFQTATSRNLV